MSKHKVLQQRFVALVAGIALVIVVAGAATGVGNTLTELATPDAAAIACNPSSQSGGGC